MSQSITICTCPNPEGHKGNVWHPGQPIPPGIKLTEEQLLAKLKEASTSTARSASFGLVVMRCGCGHPESHAPNIPGVPNLPCPHPISTTDLGVVSRTDRSLIKRLTWRFFGQRAANKRIRAANLI